MKTTPLCNLYLIPPPSRQPESIILPFTFSHLLHINDKYKKLYVNINGKMINRGNYVGDLNNVPLVEVNETFIYRVQPIGTTNSPVPDSHAVLFNTYMDSIGYCSQIFVTLDGRIYTRTKNVEWANWLQIALASEYMPRTGGFFTGQIGIIDPTYGNVGFVKGDSHNIRFYWKDNYIVAQVDGVTIGRLTITNA